MKNKRILRELNNINELVYKNESRFSMSTVHLWGETQKVAILLEEVERLTKRLYLSKRDSRHLRDSLRLELEEQQEYQALLYAKRQEGR